MNAPIDGDYKVAESREGGLCCEFREVGLCEGGVGEPFSGVLLIVAEGEGETSWGLKEDRCTAVNPVGC